MRYSKGALYQTESIYICLSHIKPLHLSPKIVHIQFFLHNCYVQVSQICFITSKCPNTKYHIFVLRTKQMTSFHVFHAQCTCVRMLLWYVQRSLIDIYVITYSVIQPLHTCLSMSWWWWRQWCWWWWTQVLTSMLFNSY